MNNRNISQKINSPFAKGARGIVFPSLVSFMDSAYIMETYIIANEQLNHTNNY